VYTIFVGELIPEMFVSYFRHRTEAPHNRGTTANTNRRVQLHEQTKMNKYKTKQ